MSKSRRQKRKNNRGDEKEPLTQLTVLVPTPEETMIAQAAQAAGARSLSAFIRDAAAEKARKVLKRGAVNPVVAAASKPIDDGQGHHKATRSADNAERLFVYIDAAVPEGARLPAAAVPSVRAFATLFSDRNRALLRHLASHAPGSITALSETLGYPYTGLQRALASLAAYGITGYHGSERAGAQLTPYLRCTRVTLSVPLTAKTGEIPHGLLWAVQASDDEIMPGACDRLLGSMDELPRLLPVHALEALRALSADRKLDAPTLAARIGLSTAALYPKLEALREAGLITMRGVHPLRPALTCEALRMELSFAPEDTSLPTTTG